MLKGTVIFDCAALHGSARIQPCRPCRPDRSIRVQACGGPRKCRDLGPAEAARVMETATGKPDSEDEPDPRKADLNIAGISRATAVSNADRRGGREYLAERLWASHWSTTRGARQLTACRIQAYLVISRKGRWILFITAGLPSLCRSSSIVKSQPRVIMTSTVRASALTTRPLLLLEEPKQ